MTNGKTPNPFQQWLLSQGYVRDMEKDSPTWGCWLLYGQPVTGARLFLLMEEFKHKQANDTAP